MPDKERETGWEGGKPIQEWGGKIVLREVSNIVVAHPPWKDPICHSPVPEGEKLRFIINV